MLRGTPWKVSREFLVASSTLSGLSVPCSSLGIHEYRGPFEFVITRSRVGENTEVSFASDKVDFADAEVRSPRARCTLERADPAGGRLGNKLLRLQLKLCIPRS